MQPVNFSRTGKYTDGRVRPVIVELQTPLQAKSVISKAIQIKLFQSKQIFISLALTDDERKLEKQVLKRRYELIQSGINRTTLRIK